MGNFGLALLVGVVAGILEWDIYGFGHTQVSRPLVVGPVIGLVMGNLPLGIAIGAAIEFIFLGQIPVGAAIPPDATTATSVATAVAILSDLDVATAMALALPVAVLAQMLQILIWMINGGMIHKGDKYAEEGDTEGITRVHLLCSAIWFLQGFIPVFCAVLFGAGAVEAVVNFLQNNIPFVLDGFKIAGTILPALGFAMLYTMMSTRKLFPYFIIGFVLAAWFSGGLISVAALGIGAALIHVNNLDKGKKTKGAKA